MPVIIQEKCISFGCFSRMKSSGEFDKNIARILTLADFFILLCSEDLYSPILRRLFFKVKRFLEMWQKS